jgi:hypothetical protein
MAFLSPLLRIARDWSLVDTAEQYADVSEG